MTRASGRRRWGPTGGRQTCNAGVWVCGGFLLVVIPCRPSRPAGGVHPMDTLHAPRPYTLMVRIYLPINTHEYQRNDPRYCNTY